MEICRRSDAYEIAGVNLTFNRNYPQILRPRRQRKDRADICGPVPTATEASGINFNQLRVNQMPETWCRFVWRKIRALRGPLRVLFLLDRVPGNADVAIMLRRQLNGFPQCHVA